MIDAKDIREREFERSFRGYDRVEVRYFLKMLTYEFSRFQKRIEELEPIEEQYEKIQGKGADQIVKEAREKAAKIIIDAEKVAANALQSARNEKKQINKTIIKLKHERDKLIHYIQTIINKEKALISQFDVEDEDIEEELNFSDEIE